MSKKMKSNRFFPLRTVVLLGIALVLLGRTLWLWPRTGWSPKGAPKPSASVQREGQKDLWRQKVSNVILISIDTLRADHLSCYGYSRQTSPNIDALAADGIIFNHAVTPVPLTLPGHSSMLTGTIPPFHGVRDNDGWLESSNITLAEILRERGFVTGAIVSAVVMGTRTGLDKGFDTYNDISEQTAGASSFHRSERSAKEISLLANKWLQRHRDEKFFLFLHYFDPHRPYKRHEKFTFSRLPFFGLFSDLYDGEIAYADHYVGQVIEKVKELNLYDSTLLIVTSDHGEGLGNHSEQTHGVLIYHSTVHVPLIVRVPGGPTGKIVLDTVGLIDVVPTVCSSVQIPVPTHVQGKDLSIFFSDSGPSIEDRSFYCESLLCTKFDLEPLFGLVNGSWKFMHTSELQLYNLAEDPRENRNLAAEHHHRTRSFQDQLRSILQEPSRPKQLQGKFMLDEKTRQQLQSLGYVSNLTVDESFQFSQSRPDPKILIAAHDSFRAFYKHLQRAEFQKAKEVCNGMLKKRPDMEQAYYYLGLIAISEKDNQAIIRNFSRYLADAEPDPNNPDIKVKPEYEILSAYVHLGAALQYEGQTERAIVNYNKALKLAQSVNQHQMISDISKRLDSCRRGRL